MHFRLKNEAYQAKKTNIEQYKTADNIYRTKLAFNKLNLRSAIIKPLQVQVQSIKQLKLLHQTKKSDVLMSNKSAVYSI